MAHQSPIQHAPVSLRSILPDVRHHPKGLRNVITLMAAESAGCRTSEFGSVVQRLTLAAE
jgi:hypothetical protein